MKKLSPAKEEELLRYLDGELDAVQRKSLEAEIAQSRALKNKLDELNVIHAMMRKTALEAPSKNFTQKVMEGLETQPARSFISPRKGLLLFIGIIIASGVALVLLSSGVFDQTTISLVVDAPIKNKWMEDLSLSIPFNIKMLVNGILFLNLGLALVLLDRTILRPLFQNRTYPG